MDIDKIFDKIIRGNVYIITGLASEAKITYDYGKFYMIVEDGLGYEDIQAEDEDFIRQEIFEAINDPYHYDTQFMFSEFDDDE